ncbi:MAG TPA: alcohol dehydrogenase catalytic domain-containing protein [Candidatus Saccharimonadales bacterium]|nr:alcohol dehydrogenase catalytic domain-containing protein [Candidatus Saccharimonadales bacterium]
MRAVVLHGPGDLRLDDIPEPALPPGGLLVRPGAVGICGSDVRTWRHGSPRLRGPQVLGHEFAGTVVTSDVASFLPGTPVAVCPGAPCDACRACSAGLANLCRQRRVLGYDLPGGMADLVAVPADWIRTGGIVALDPAEPIERGAIVEPLHTVFNGQDQIRIAAGERVLVLGLGPIGVLHVALARSAGATVHGLDPDADRVARAATILGTGVVDRLLPGPNGAAGAHDEDGADVVIVAVGARDALATAIASVAPGGRILAFGGLPPDARTIELDMNDLHYRQLAIQGAFGGTPETFRRAAAWLAANPLDTAAFAPDRFPLADAVAAFEAVAAGHGLKTLLVADGGEGSALAG